MEWNRKGENSRNRRCRSEIQLGVKAMRWNFSSTIVVDKDKYSTATAASSRPSWLLLIGNFLLPDACVCLREFNSVWNEQQSLGICSATSWLHFKDQWTGKVKKKVNWIFSSTRVNCCLFVCFFNDSHRVVDDWVESSRMNCCPIAFHHVNAK